MRPTIEPPAAAASPPTAGGTGPPALARTLRLPAAVAIVVGSVIGSGIFKKAAPMADALPSPLLVLGVWLLAGVAAGLGALSAAELTAAFPEGGGLYAHLRRVFGRFTGYLYGWSALSVILTGSIASVAYVFAQYLGYFGHWGRASPEIEGLGWRLFGLVDLYPFRELGTKLVAVACIAFATAINVWRVRLGAAVQELLTVIKLLILAGIVGVCTRGAGSLQQATASPLLPDLHNLVGGITLALSGAFFAYGGWINATFVAGELERPARDAPRALVGGLLVVIVVYLAVNLAYFYLLPLERVRTSELVAADAVGSVFPSAGAALVAAAVAICAFGAVNGFVLAAPRVYHAMARDGLLPAAVARVHPRFQSPIGALLVQGVWASALVFSGTFNQIPDMLIFVAWAFYGLLAAAMIVARVRFPDVPRPYRAPGYPWLPGAFVLFCAAFVVLSVLKNTRNAVAGLLLVAIGIPFYFYGRRGKGAKSRGPGTAPLPRA